MRRLISIYAGSEKDGKTIPPKWRITRQMQDNHVGTTCNSQTSEKYVNTLIYGVHVTVGSMVNPRFSLVKCSCFINLSRKISPNTNPLNWIFQWHHTYRGICMYIYIYIDDEIWYIYIYICDISYIWYIYMWYIIYIWYMIYDIYIYIYDIYIYVIYIYIYMWYIYMWYMMHDINMYIYIILCIY